MHRPDVASRLALCRRLWISSRASTRTSSTPGHGLHRSPPETRGSGCEGVGSDWAGTSFRALGPVCPRRKFLGRGLAAPFSWPQIETRNLLRDANHEPSFRYVIFITITSVWNLHTCFRHVKTIRDFCRDFLFGVEADLEMGVVREGAGQVWRSGGEAVKSLAVSTSSGGSGAARCPARCARSARRRWAVRSAGWARSSRWLRCLRRRGGPSPSGRRSPGP